MWVWIRLQKTNCTDRVRNKELLKKTKEKNNIHTINWRKANWFCDLFRGNCFLKHVIEGKTERRTEVPGRWGRKCKQLLNYFKEKKRYWKLRVEAIVRTVWRTGFGRSCGPVVRQTTEWMNEWMNVILLICRNDTVRYGHLSSQNMKEIKVKRFYSTSITTIRIFRLHILYCHSQFIMKMMMIMVIE